MPELTRTLHSPRETFELAQRIAGQLAPGTVLALYGQLGAGKTQFAKGLGAGLGLDPATITSPTFVLCVNHAEGRLPFHHLDAYRMSGAAELDDLGWNDLRAGGGVILVEWAERVEDILPPESIRIYLDHTTHPDERSLRIAGGAALRVD